MKAIVCLMCVVAVAANPAGRYVLTYDNSFEDGVWDTSLEWIPSGAPVSVRGANAGTNPLPYYMKADSSEEVMSFLGDSFLPVARTRSQRVEDLTQMLNSGRMDFSDEWMLRSVLNNPERFGNRPYYVDHSGEVNFLPFGVSGGAGGQAQGSGVQPVKK